MLKYVCGGIGMAVIVLGLQSYIKALQPYSLWFIFGGILVFVFPLLLKLFNWLFAKDVLRGKKEKANVSVKKKLESLRGSILLTISNNQGIVDAEVAELLSIGTDVAAFHLEELKKIKFAKVAYIQGSDWENIPYREEWSTDHLGRKYLVYHKLIN